MNSPANKEIRRLFQGMAFISPNIAGFLMFTLVPLVLSFAMAFTNWDLQQHNRFKADSVQFVGIENFTRLLSDPLFWKYLGNTFFLMLVIPFGIAGSLAAALLLHRNPHERLGISAVHLLTTTVLIAACILLAAWGLGASALMLLVSSLVGLILLGGAAGGTTTYRTLFYLPHFTQGVAVFILWKKLYNPTSGPINVRLEPVLQVFESVGRHLPDFFPLLAAGLMNTLLAACWAWGFNRQLRAWMVGDCGTTALVAGQALNLIPLLFMVVKVNTAYPAWISIGFWGLAAIMVVWINPILRRESVCPANHAIGGALLLGGVLIVWQFILLGMGLSAYHLPAASAIGIQPPLWLADYHWAKPSLMIISLWAAIGSNNMILYLAGLSNVPQELYEAADIDGASRWQKFAFITWPQLAPVTFFIVVMSFIYGLQGGFEMARTMTGGGPAGATTTLSYYIYSEGFETGRLGYASAVAWVLFLIVFAATLVNWRFGNRYVAD